MNLGSRVFVAVAVAAICATAIACGSSNTVQNASRIDWLAYSPVQPTDTEKSVVLTLGELSSQVDFSLVLPTSLPDGVNRNMFRDDFDKTSTNAQARIYLIANAFTDAPTIAIYETKPAAATTEQCNSSDCETADVSGTTVACRVVIPGPGVSVSQPPPPTATSPELNPRLRCQWNQGELSIQTELGWVLDQAVPGGVSPEMRAENMDVISSMITSPYTVAVR